MKIRKRRWVDSATGELKEAWMIDVKVTGQDGVLRRVRRVAPIQNRRAAERMEHQLREELLSALVLWSIFSTRSGSESPALALVQSRPSR